MFVLDPPLFAVGLAVPLVELTAPGDKLSPGLDVPSPLVTVTLFVTVTGPGALCGGLENDAESEPLAEAALLEILY